MSTGKPTLAQQERVYVMKNYVVEYETTRGWICVHQGGDLEMANEWLEFFTANHPFTPVRLTTEEVTHNE